MTSLDFLNIYYTTDVVSLPLHLPCTCIQASFACPVADIYFSISFSVPGIKLGSRDAEKEKIEHSGTLLLNLLKLSKVLDFVRFVVFKFRNGNDGW
jgi:hypothetical protein